jgi:hypothetical protein
MTQKAKKSFEMKKRIPRRAKKAKLSTSFLQPTPPPSIEIFLLRRVSMFAMHHCLEEETPCKKLADIHPKQGY